MNTGDTVTIITGRAKSGKTALILQKIAENEKNGRKSLFIVPSQNSFEYEKMLAHACGGGFMNAQVCGLYRLGDKLLEEAGLSDNFVNAQGRIMIIRRAVEEAELGIFRDAAGKPGFALMCDEYISNFQTCDLDSKQIKEAIEKLNHDTVLYEKMADLCRIYEKTEEYLEKTGAKIKAASETLAACIASSDICKADIFFDGIENPFVQTYKIIEAMLPVAHSMTIALEADSSSDEAAFARGNTTFYTLRNVIEGKNNDKYKINHIYLEKENKYSCPVFNHIEREFWKFPSAAFSGDSSQVELISASDMTAEVEMVIAAITEKAKSGVRYRNMALICAGMDEYDIFVKSKFAQADIPIFSDNKLNLLCTPLAELILSALACIRDNFRTDDCISLIKTNMTGLTWKETEAFENYLITSGKCGKDITEALPSDKTPARIEDIRRKVIEPLKIMQSAMAHGTIAEKVSALYEYLGRLNAEKQLKKLTEKLEEAGNTIAARQYARVYELVDTTLMKLSEVLGDIRVSNDDFSEILAEGLNADIIGIIPSSVDMVYFDDVTGNVPKEAEYIFIIGARDGSFPPNRRDDKIIDDTELSILQSNGLNVWLSTAHTRDHDNEKMYRLISSADKLLYVSYPMLVGKTPTVPSAFMNKMREMLGREKFDSDVDFSCRYRLHNMDSFARSMRRLADKRKIDDTDAAYIAWFMKQEKYADECNKLTDAIFFDPSPSPLGAEVVKALYGGKVYGSVSKIETYYRCPFRYFAEYTLNAQERKAYSPENNDVGSFIHDVLDRFFKYIIDENKDIRTISDEECDDIIKACVLAASMDYRNGLFEYNSKLRSQRDYYAGKAAQVIHAVIRQLKKGSYEVCATETGFDFPDKSKSPYLEYDLSSGGKLSMTGKIDRVDKYNDGEDHYKIVDYKTGSAAADFSVKKLYAGVQIQLPIYLEAICGDELDGVGMYYQGISSAPASSNGDEEQTARIDKALRMDGVTASEDVKKKNDDGDDSGVDIGILKALSSDKASDVVANKTIGNDVPAYMSRKSMAALRRFAVKRAKQAAESILSGDISPHPYSEDGKATVCDYCQFKWVCLFGRDFPSCKKRTVKDIDIGEIFDEEV